MLNADAADNNRGECISINAEVGVDFHFPTIIIIRTWLGMEMEMKIT